MPRQGARPYECVRRAWHSDRHQPIRGSLIQEIFRIANEIHSPTTKKNKEWQEKLPIVVLKAEEIIYSKANSQVEYMDMKTLWERANDAINTIIRREEASEETGEFLQPCIEAALHLGCIPRRATRSQRNNQPRGYLSGNINLTSPKEHSPKSTSSHYPINFITPLNSCIITEMPFLSHQNYMPINTTYPLCHPSHSQMGPNNFPKMEISKQLSLSINNHPNEEECDLSLRLGFGHSDSSPKVKNKSKGKLNLYCDMFDVGVVAKRPKANEQQIDQQHYWHTKVTPSCYSYGGTTRTTGL